MEQLERIDAVKWKLGEDALIAAAPRPAPAVVECECPEFCRLDHGN
jgi:hypothetical protein